MSTTQAPQWKRLLQKRIEIHCAGGSPPSVKQHEMATIARWWLPVWPQSWGVCDAGVPHAVQPELGFLCCTGAAPLPSPWNSWNLVIPEDRDCLLFSVPSPGGSKQAPSPPPLLSLWACVCVFFPFGEGEREGGQSTFWRRPGNVPALCVVCRDGAGGLFLSDARGYLTNSEGFSLITYLITEEFEQCVCFGKGGEGSPGDVLKTTSFFAGHFKRPKGGGGAQPPPAIFSLLFPQGREDGFLLVLLDCPLQHSSK